MSNQVTLHTLGCGSAKPTLRHQPSSGVLNVRGNLFMIDCGEGAQLALQRHKLGLGRLGHIFLTHLHGDHVFGLPGLVGTLALGMKGGSLTIHTFQEGKEILTKILNYFNRETPFDVNFNVIEPTDALIYENRSFTVRTVRLDHRVDCVGFVFEEKEGPRHINSPMCKFHEVPISMMNRLKAGEDFIKDDGTVIPNHILTTPPTEPWSYAHISDTAYMPELAGKIEGVDLLFHETTYCEEDAHLARQRGHSTAKEAAMVARDAHAGHLLTGHYSSRYKDDTRFLQEASSIFPSTILNREGLVTPIR